jgi:four helix bundle protein
LQKHGRWRETTRSGRSHISVCGRRAAFYQQLPRTLANTEDVRQLVRASGSVAANWIEADEALSKKDFLMRVKICRKEAKESRLFLRLLDAGLTKNTVSSRDGLAKEACELTFIFSAIISKSGGL